MLRTCLGETPIWSSKLRFPKLGEQVFVEVLPNLALRVRDRATNEVLAQSMPGDFHAVDNDSLSAEQQFHQWIAARGSQPAADSPQPNL